MTVTASSTIPDLLRARSQEMPERAAIIMDGAKSLTFGDWERRSSDGGGVLQHARHVERGQRVGLFFDDHEWIEYAVAYCAILKAGAVAVHLGPHMAGSEVQRRLDQCEVVGVIHGMSDAPQEGRGWRAGIGALESSPPASLKVEIGPDDLADILYTSGTTGTPKGVQVTHGNHTFGRLAQVQRMFEKSEHFLGPFPMGTNSSQAMVNFALSGGPAVLVMSSFEPQRIYALIEQFHVDHLMLAPSTATQLINAELDRPYDVSSVRTVSTGSTYIAPATTKALAAVFSTAKVLTYYGSGESAPAIASAPFDPEHPTPLRASPGTEIAICDETGERLPPGAVGEIWLRSPAPPRCYHKDPERNARVYTDGWTHTGDLGSLDEDGGLHVFDRVADAIRRDGTLVSSQQIEGLLYDCPQILEAAVVGVPDPVMGQAVAAAIVLKPGASVDDFCRFIESHFSEQQIPAIIRQVESLPRGPIWKVLKREVRSWFQPGTERGTPVTLLPQAATAGSH